MNWTLDDMFFVAWAAGFFDGEGCVSAGYVTSGRYPQFKFALMVSQVDPRPLHALRDRWGGAVRAKRSTNPNHKDQWTWAIQGESAAVFAAEILPFLKVKAEVVSAVLPVLFRTHRKGVRFKPEEIAQRHAVLAVIREANHRGPRGEATA